MTECRATMEILGTKVECGMRGRHVYHKVVLTGLDELSMTEIVVVTWSNRKREPTP